MTSRAVLYARFSSDLQRDASIEDQLRSCRDYAARKGFEVTEVYSDRAVSGASLMRPGIQKLLEDARGGGFDVVIAEALDRLSRNQADIARLFERLQFYGVRIETVSEGVVSELHIGLTGTMNALFLRELGKKTHRGLKGKALAGKSAGGITYGYKAVTSFAANGEPVRGEREIDPVLAALVRRIFEDYARGISPAKIAEQLNAEGIPGPGRAHWGASTIQGHRERGTGILNNELYVSRQVWNRLRYVKDPGTGKRISRLNPESEWVVTEVPELRIIDPDLWDTARVRQGALKSKGTGTPVWDRRRPRFLFSGLMACGCCGSGFSKVSQHSFGCSSARNKGAAVCTNRLTIRRDLLEGRVLDALAHHLMDPDLVDLFCRDYIAERNRLAAAADATRSTLETELRQVTRDHRKLVDAIIAGVPAAQVKDRMIELDTRRKELEQTLARPTASPPLRLHPSMAHVYRDRVAALIRALDQATEMDAAKEALRALVERIVLTPDEGGKALAIDLQGDLAGLLHLATGQPIQATPTPAHANAAPGKRRGTVEGLNELVLVAGTGFEPVTFRL